MGLFRWRRDRTPVPGAPGPHVDREAVPGDIRPDFIAHAGTPTPGSPGWRGILINAPRCLVVRPRPPDPLFGNAPRAVIWGTCLLPDRPGEGHDDYRTGILLVAVEVAKRAVYRGRVTRPVTFGSVHVPATLPLPQVIPPPSAAGCRSASGGPFNPDLIDVCGIPLTDACYEIFALSGAWRSNVIDVEVRFANE